MRPVEATLLIISLYQYSAQSLHEYLRVGGASRRGDDLVAPRREERNRHLKEWRQPERYHEVLSSSPGGSSLQDGTSGTRSCSSGSSKSAVTAAAAESEEEAKMAVAAAAAAASAGQLGRGRLYDYEMYT